MSKLPTTPTELKKELKSYYEEAYKGILSSELIEESVKWHGQFIDKAFNLALEMAEEALGEDVEVQENWEEGDYDDQMDASYNLGWNSCLESARENIKKLKI